MNPRNLKPLNIFKFRQLQVMMIEINTDFKKRMSANIIILKKS